MLKIIRAVAVTWHVFLNTNASFEVRLQDVHLNMAPASVIGKDGNGNGGTYLIEEQNQGRTSQERARTNFLPQIDRILLETELPR